MNELEKILEELDKEFLQELEKQMETLRRIQNGETIEGMA